MLFYGCVGSFAPSFVNVVFSRLVLVAMGFYALPDKLTSVQMRNNNITFSSKNIGASTSHGHIIVSNHVSYIDYLAYCSKYAPTFTECDRDGVIRVSNLFKIMCRTFFQAGSDVCKKPRVCCAKNILVFPEGMTTNGRAIARFHKMPDLPEMSERNDLGFRICFIRYESVCNNWTTENPFVHLIQVCMKPYNSVRITSVLLDNEHMLQLRSTVFRDRDVHDILASVMSKLAKIPYIATIGSADKLEFTRYYRERQFGHIYKK